MVLKSTFTSDLEKEQKLCKLLDSCYQKYLKQYDFKRIDDIERQMQGIDVIFRQKSNGKEFNIDEKAQLDYINEELPTFAFELSYQKRGKRKKGWLFDTDKKTDFYALATAIYSDEPNKFTSCKITFVNRKKLIFFLEEKGLTELSLQHRIAQERHPSGKLEIHGLRPKKEGYLYFSTLNKAEKPTNLVLKLDFLIQNGIAKKLV